VIYGENYRLLRAQQLQEKGNQVDPAGRTGESDTVLRTTKEVGLSANILLAWNEVCGRCRNVAIALTDQRSKREMAR
jgi:hypothetical protein